MIDLFLFDNCAMVHIEKPMMTLAMPLSFAHFTANGTMRQVKKPKGTS
ncbi:MAG TPA: hypothetical protein VJ577_04110 [Burkholderiaceae bacterium]|nr:hypothetical protein [Burkholderiaceae bacterium]